MRGKGEGEEGAAWGGGGGFGSAWEEGSPRTPGPSAAACAPAEGGEVLPRWKGGVLRVCSQGRVM